MEEALRQLLASYAPLAELVGSRIFWADIPQGTTGDLIVMHKIIGVPSYQMNGPIRLESSRVQINTRTGLIKSSWAISRAVKDRLSGFKGVVAGVTFGGIFLEDEGELPTDDPAGPQIFRGTRSDYLVWASA